MYGTLYLMKGTSNLKVNKRAAQETQPTWTFFTNHTHVLVYLALHGSMPLKDVALAIGLTERGVQRIVMELEASGVLTIEKVGRRNHYQLNADVALRHPLENHCTIGQILAIILKGSAKRLPPK